MKNKCSINKKRLISTFIELIKINSPSFKEDVIASYLQQVLSQLGFRVDIQEYRTDKYRNSYSSREKQLVNIVAAKRGKRRTSTPLLLSGHMDTIEPTTGIKYEIKGNVIRSVGDTVLGADDKGAIAQIIEAVTSLDEQGAPYGDIEVVLTSAEERGLLGAKNLDMKKIRSRHALVLDSGGPVGKIVIAAPSHITYEMHITGISAHAGIEPEKGVSAISVAAEIISNVPDGRIDAVTTANIGIISGGTATNVVPKRVVVNGEIRSHNPLILKRVAENIFNLARQIARNRHAKVKIIQQEDYRSFRIKKDEPFLEYINCVFNRAGITPEHTVTGGGSDANIFNRKGIKALNISNGMQKVHSHEEFICIDDLVKGSTIVMEAIKGFADFGTR